MKHRDSFAALLLQFAEFVSQNLDRGVDRLVAVADDFDQMLILLIVSACDLASSELFSHVFAEKIQQGLCFSSVAFGQIEEIVEFFQV